MAASILRVLKQRGWSFCGFGHRFAREVPRREISFKLDEKTAHSTLDLFGKDTGVIYRMLGIDPTKVPQNPERFRDWAIVLGDTAMSSGCHYWEVTVKRSQEFRIGVADVDISREVCLGMDDHSWVFTYADQCWNAMFANETTPISITDNLERVGLLLNCSSSSTLGLVDTNKHVLIHSMPVPFQRPLVPAFALWDGELLTHSGLDVPEKLKEKLNIS
ncbi:SPRY domain-containing protein 4 [Varanus komodoensis]|uniref:SPRY domain-containing protein 4 n=1 Tax=Varanus komodoensis TaxID=61221 RepID=UPI001CF78A28|nr:SPRY domain-containing protein 4 [Varanus komodoensis]KAF7246897.1 SPRY domain-containing protein 4 [Varanus komodoensis]